jgi:hypothetical protein
MKAFLKKIINPIRLILGGLIFVIFKKNTNFGYQGMVGTFCNTRGYSTKILSKIIQVFKKPYILEKNISGVLGEFDVEKIKNIVINIENKGYHVFEQGLSTETCDALLEFATQTEAFVRPVNVEDADDSVSGYKQRQKIKIDRENPIVIRYDFLPEELMNNVEIQKLLADISMIAIAQEYLKCKPKSDVMGMWWHTAFSKEENAQAATMYHFDMDRIKWLKFFFYLTDTTKETGAHQFIEGSHNGNIPKKFLKQGYARLKCTDVINHYGIEKEITYEAPRGTIIAEDTSGLHRGNPVQRDDRLLFQIQFSNSLFGAESKTTKIDMENVHSDLKERIEQYPDIYELYTTDTHQFRG